MAAPYDIPYDDTPGTILLTERADGDGLNRPHQGDVILQPMPSTDPEDPLNWAHWRKMLAIGNVYLYVFAIGITTAVQYSVLTQISEAQDLPLSTLNLGTGLMFLFSGWGCLIWQPLAMAYGRRFVYITSIVLSIIPMVWAPYGHGKGQWYAHRTLLGIFVAPVESLPEVSVPDLFFAHERGTWMSLYSFILFGSNFLAPFFAGFINDGVGWEWVMFFGALVTAVSAVIMFFTMEDTIYFRDTAEGGVVQSEKTDPNAVDEAAPSHPAPRTYVQKLNLVTLLPKRPSFVQVLGKSWRAVKIFVFFPSIVWAGLLYGTNLAWYNIMNGTMSSILGGSPYNFSPAMVGVAYLSPFIFGGIGSVWCGWFADKMVLRLTRRNGGIREPEQRLWALAASGLLSTAGLVLWGVGASQGVQFMGLIFGVGFVSLGVVCGGAITLAYAVDCFKEIDGESMVTIIVIRNTLGFGFSFALNPWLDALGEQNCFISVAAIALVCNASFLVMIFKGKQLRRFSAKRYWSYAMEDREHYKH